MLDGTHGPAVQLAMRILTRMAPLYGASSLLPVTRAHIDGVILTGAAGLEFAERLADLGGQVAVPTTLNVMSMDRQRWRDLNLDAAFAERALSPWPSVRPDGRATDIHLRSLSDRECPLLRRTDRLVGIERRRVRELSHRRAHESLRRLSRHLLRAHRSSASRRAPSRRTEVGYGRRGTRAIPAELPLRDDFYPVLGYLLGSIVADEVPVVAGLERPADRGPAEGDGRGSGVFRRGGNVPHRRHHARGSDPRRRPRQPATAAHGARLYRRLATDARGIDDNDRARESTSSLSAALIAASPSAERWPG